MRHIAPTEIAELGASGDMTSGAREHLAQCVLCQDRVAAAQRVECALAQLGRVEPATDLAARILASLPRASQRRAAAQPWLGVTTLLAAMLGFALAFQTAFTLRANGAFDLVAYYTAQPEIVTTYPSEAWSALAAAIPWMTVGISFAVLAIALLLTVQWTSHRTLRLLR